MCLMSQINYRTKRRALEPDVVYELTPGRIHDIKRIIKELDDKILIKTLRQWLI